jgi:hypothetical protein
MERSFVIAAWKPVAFTEIEKCPTGRRVKL